MHDIAIVLVGYNRAKCLNRLLNSVLSADFQNLTPQIYICIDHSPVQDQVIQYLEESINAYPAIKLIKQKKNLGLKEHILQCGDLVRFHDALIMLEDDLVVSPLFYQYAQKAFTYYHDSPELASIALFTYEYDESRFYRFQPLEDDSDVHFIQIPCSWGQLWTSKQWNDFRVWLTSQDETLLLNCLPEYAKEWGTESWKKIFMAYMIQKDLYTAFPNNSLTINFEELGTNSSSNGLFSPSLNLENSDWKFKRLEASKSVYDSWFEITPESLKKWNSDLTNLAFDVDIKRSKSPINYITSSVLTFSDNCKPEYTFSNQLSPVEANVALGYHGSSLGIVPKEKIEPLIDHVKYYYNLSLVPDTTGITLRTFGVLVIVLGETLDQLAETLRSISNLRTGSIVPLVCCSAEIYSEVYQVVLSSAGIIPIISCREMDVVSLIDQGFEKLKINNRIGYLCWIYSGNVLNPQPFKFLHNFTTKNFHINAFKGIAMGADSNYLTENAAPYRIEQLNMQQSEYNQRVSNTEGVFFKKEFLLSGLFSKTCLSGDVKKQLSAVIALQFFETVNAPLTKISIIDVLNGKYFFLKNIPYLRAFYRMTHKLPDLYRYDPVHKDFYKIDY